jgi:hypothetical protein
MPDEPIPLQLDELTTSFSSNIQGTASYIERVRISECRKIVDDIHLTDLKLTTLRYPALLSVLGDIVKVVGIEEAMKMGENNIISENPTLQRIILRAISSKCEDHIKATHDLEGVAKYLDYQQFINSYLASIKSLEKRIKDDDSPLPNIAGSLLLAFDEAGRNIKTNNIIPKFSSRDNIWREKIRTYYTTSSQAPELSPADWGSQTFTAPVEEVRISFLKTIPKDFVDQVVG